MNSLFCCTVMSSVQLFSFLRSIKEEVSSLDEQVVQRFSDGVSLMDGKYHVEVPWKEEVADVPSNFSLCKSIMLKVRAGLCASGKFTLYNDVFKQQLADGIIEEATIEPNNNTHIYVSHRPVFKCENNVTTKTRAVLNCSLKSGDAPSLNEAAS